VRHSYFRLRAAPYRAIKGIGHRTHRTDRGRAIGPIGPMSPMPYGIRRRSLVEGVGGRTPFSGRLLAREHEAGSVRASKANKKGREILASAALRVGDCLHRS
jgi:hypothetical protein